jgi:hypothetical protein
VNLFLIALFAVPALSLIVWHFAFLIAVNQHYANRQEKRIPGPLSR